MNPTPPTDNHSLPGDPDSEARPTDFLAAAEEKKAQLKADLPRLRDKHAQAKAELEKNPESWQCKIREKQARKELESAERTLGSKAPPRPTNFLAAAREDIAREKAAQRERDGEKKPTRPAAAAEFITADENHPYTRKALEDLEAFRAMPPNSGRNDQLNKLAGSLGRITSLPREKLIEQLVQACKDNGLWDEDGEKQCLATIESGLRHADTQPPRGPTADEHSAPYTFSVDAPETETEETVFGSRPVLSHIREYARERGASPWAVLGVALVHATCAIPPSVVLPDIVGSVASLNLALALVGQSGHGKNMSERLGSRVINWNIPEPPPVLPLGTGEGIARTFDAGGCDWQESAIFSASEVDTFTALNSRTGSTVEATLRSMIMGETIGFANGRKETRVIIPAHSYRAGLIFGVQPARAGALMSDAAVAGGTPQRFLWLPTRDPFRRDKPTPPDQRSRERLATPPTWPIVGPDGLTSIAVPEFIRQVIWDAQNAIHRDDDAAAALDGHLYLTRLKIAAGLMVLDERSEMNDDDWRLAGVLLEVSNAQRAAVQRAITEANRRGNRARGYAMAERDEAAGELKVKRARQAIVRWFARNHRDGDWVSHSAARRGTVTGELRDQFETAIAELIEDGSLESRPATGRRGGTFYRWRGGTPGVADENAL